MVNYKQRFKDFWSYAENEYIPCAGCKSKSVDIHHLKFKSQGGKDVIENLAPVCRKCHNLAHNCKEFNEILKQTHANNIKYKLSNS